MRKPSKLIIVSQHYPPDPSTTAAIMAAIAGHLSSETPLVVLSGTPGSANQEAINSVKLWRFKPGMRLGQAVPVQVMIDVEFQLR